MLAVLAHGVFWCVISASLKLCSEKLHTVLELDLQTKRVANLIASVACVAIVPALPYVCGRVLGVWVKLSPAHHPLFPPPGWAAHVHPAVA